MPILTALNAVAVDHSDGADTKYSKSYHWDAYFTNKQGYYLNTVMQAVAADANVTANFDIEYTLDGTTWFEAGITSDGVTNTSTATIGSLPPCLYFRVKALTTAGGSASTISAYISVP